MAATKPTTAIVQTDKRVLVQAANIAEEMQKFYEKRIANFFGDQKSVSRFMSSVMATIERNPKLLECTRESVINSFLTLAELRLMPSSVSGEAYVIPFDNSKKVGTAWVKIKEAQPQIGYKGWVTLGYRGGAIKDIIAEAVHENDDFKVTEGRISHNYDPFKERGAVKGYYVIIRLSNGGQIEKAMSSTDILNHAKKYSKSFNSSSSPWTAGGNDMHGWMPKKTVLLQALKLVPKSDELNQAMAVEYLDSTLEDKKEQTTFNGRLTAALTAGGIRAKETPNETKKADEEVQEEQTMESSEGPTESKPGTE